MRFHKKVIDEKAWEILSFLSKNNILKGFYLAGGTGCALILGHRYSFDFDFFSEKKFNSSSIIKKILSLKSLRLNIEKEEEDTLIFFVKDIMFSFFYYPYKLLENPLCYKGIDIASLFDLGCMKLDTIAGRGKKRDFIDLYFIAKKIPLKELFSLYIKKYKIKNNIMHVIRSLTYFEDAEKDPMPKMIKKIEWKEIKEFFLNIDYLSIIKNL